MPTNQPRSFLGAPNGGARPGQVAARVVAVPAPESFSADPPLLTLRYPNTCILSKAFLDRLPYVLKGERRVLLVPPIKHGGAWHLDTRPAPGIGSTLPERGRAEFRVHPIAKVHFMLPKPVLTHQGKGGHQGGASLGTIGNENVLLSRRRFVLGSEVAGHPGLYELLPHAGSVPK